MIIALISTIEIGQKIKCISKNELKNSYVNQTNRRFWAYNLLKQNKNYVTKQWENIIKWWVSL